MKLQRRCQLQLEHFCIGYLTIWPNGSAIWKPISCISQDFSLPVYFLRIKMRVGYKMLCDILIPKVSQCLYLGVCTIQKTQKA